MLNSDERTIQRRLDQIRAGRRNALEDYTSASEAVRSAHDAWNLSKLRKAPIPASVQDRYAQALRDQAVCARILEILKIEAA